MKSSASGRSLRPEERAVGGANPMPKAGPSRREFLAAAGAGMAICLFGLPLASAEEKKRTKVGIILPQKGREASEAESLLAGIELHLKERGSSPLEILRRDSGADDEKTLVALAELVMNREVQYLIGPPTLTGSERIIHGLTEGKVVVFITHPSVRLIAGELCPPAGFRVRPNTWQSGQPLAPWAVKNTGVRVFITGDDDEPGNEVADAFAYAFEKAGGQFVDRVMIPTDGGKPASIVEAAGKSTADFVFASFREKSAEAFLKAWHTAHPTKKLVGPESLTAFPGTVAAAGKSAAGVPTLGFLDNPVKFAAKLKKDLGKEVLDAARAAEGYDIAQIICRAVLDGPKEKDGLSGLIAYIEGMEIDGPRGKVRFDRNHEPILEAMVQEWGVAGKTRGHTVVAKLGTCSSPDFGCGRVGFPKRPELETKEEEPLWIDDGE